MDVCQARCACGASEVRLIQDTLAEHTKRAKDGCHASLRHFHLATIAFDKSAQAASPTLDGGRLRLEPKSRYQSQLFASTCNGPGSGSSRSACFTSFR